VSSKQIGLKMSRLPSQSKANWWDPDLLPMLEAAATRILNFYSHPNRDFVDKYDLISATWLYHIRFHSSLKPKYCYVYTIKFMYMVYKNLVVEKATTKYPRKPSHYFDLENLGTYLGFEDEHKEFDIVDLDDVIKTYCNDREQYVLYARMSGRLLREIGEVIGLTEEGTRLVIVRAVEKCRVGVESGIHFKG